MNVGTPPRTSSHLKIISGIFLAPLPFPVTAAAVEVLSEAGNTQTFLEKFEKGKSTWDIGQYVAHITTTMPS